MQKITDFTHLNAEITACLRPGLVTNCALSGQKLRELVATGQLEAHRWPGGLLLLTRTPAAIRLYFYCTDESIPLDITLPEHVVCEYVPRAGRPLLPTPWWESAGFRRILTRTRLTRPVTPVAPPPASAPAPVPDACVQAAHDVLCACFSPETGCIPTVSALKTASEEGCLLLRMQSGTCVAVLHAEAARGAVELRHLAVLPAARQQGLAASLVQEFTARFGGTLCRVWTAETNTIAQKLYQINGFTPDGSVSAVWKTERN